VAGVKKQLFHANMSLNMHICSLEEKGILLFLIQTANSLLCFPC